ncbi:MAG: amidohydrolase [Pseudonocardiaceae bacterium]
MTGARAELKSAVCRQVDAIADELVAVSHAVHRFAEPAFAEHQSAARLASAAQHYGLRVGHAPGGLLTAFVADAGTRGPTVVIFSEYDALPGLGHACGHNVIAAAGLGAAAALCALGDRMTGRVRLIGSPAEEGGGGKVLLARAGVLRDVHAALLVHPNAFETARPNIIAALQLDVHTLGRAAHASLFPERGINALDAMLLGFTGISAIRPGLPAGGQVHGVLLRGGTAPGVVPDRAQARFLVRAATLRTLRPVAARVLHTLRSGAAAVGAGLRVRAVGPAYAELRTDPALAAAWERNAAALGRRLVCTVPARRTGSSDLGNVSHLVPTIHPMIAISDGDVVPHTRPFAAAAASPRADRAVLDGAKALAMTAVDIWQDAGIPPTSHNWR